MDRHLGCPSAAPRVGETRGKTEWPGTHARTRPEALAAGQAAGWAKRLGSDSERRDRAGTGYARLLEALGTLVLVEDLEAACGPKK